MIESASKGEITPEAAVRRANDALSCLLGKETNPTLSDNCSFEGDQQNVQEE